MSVEQVEEKLERELTPEEADEKAAVVLPADVVSGIGDSNWKTRLGAMESMIQVSVDYGSSISQYTKKKTRHW